MSFRYPIENPEPMRIPILDKERDERNVQSLQQLQATSASPNGSWNEVVQLQLQKRAGSRFPKLRRKTQ